MNGRLLGAFVRPGVSGAGRLSAPALVVPPSARFLALLFSLLRRFSYGRRTKTEHHAPGSGAGSWPLMLCLAISWSDYRL